LQLHCNIFNGQATMSAEQSPDPHLERPRPAGKPRLQAAALLAGSREVIIEHAGEEYRLRLTKNGKLILTK
jgi:hemin uptake protein HemP